MGGVKVMIVTRSIEKAKDLHIYYIKDINETIPKTIRICR